MKIKPEDLQKLFQYSYSLTSNYSQSEDLTQSAIEKYIAKSIDVEKPIAYLRTIIRNTFIDDCRRSNKVSFDTIENHESCLVDTTDLEQLYINQNTIKEITKQLSVGENETLYLWAALGFTAKEIAEETQQSRNTVLSRLYRIRQKLIANTESNGIKDAAGENHE